MFDIRCDHRRGWWPFVWQCRAKAVKHLLHHPANGYGKDPQVLLLCEKHFVTHIGWAERVVVQARQQGRPLVLSNIVKDTGNI